LDEQYDPLYKVKSYLNVIPKKEIDWHRNINKYYKFDKNVGKFGAWVTVNKNQRTPKKFIYVTTQRDIKKNKRVDKAMEFQKRLISLYYPEFSPYLYSNKDTEYRKIWWKIMREKNLKKRYDKYKIEHGGESPLPTAIDLDTPIDVDTFPDYPKIKHATKYKELGGWDNIEKSINIKDHVVIHNEDAKGFAYVILTQLNPKLWGRTKLQQNIEHPEYYSTDLRLRGYVTELRGIVQKIEGYPPVQNNKYIIGEKFLPTITKYFKKPLILFHTSNKRRTIEIFFPGDSGDIYLSSQVYDDPLTDYFKEEGRHYQKILRLSEIQFRLDVFNRYNNIEEKITLDTTMGTMLDCYLNNPDVIAVWLSYYPKLEIIL
jgi:hypothetical protein